MIGFNSAADALGNECAVIHTRAGEHHEEFLAPIAADHILCAEIASDGGSDHLEDSISSVVAEGVIEVLEMVNIDHNRADRHAVAREYSSLRRRIPKRRLRILVRSSMAASSVIFLWRMELSKLGAAKERRVSSAFFC